jgi:hypothetical protein
MGAMRVGLIFAPDAVAPEVTAQSANLAGRRFVDTLAPVEEDYVFVGLTRETARAVHDQVRVSTAPSAVMVITASGVRRSAVRL